ncbi:MAG: hypothetical protein ACREXW_11490 [Gammaproteobacteria bacterium]
MLKVPAFQYYEDMRVTVYQDDTKWWKFYEVPDYVSVRKDINGNPVALLVKYAFSDQDREEKPDLPRGGGLMNFDVELKVMESDEETLRKRLQKYVDGEWKRLKSLADSQNVPVQSLTLPSWHNRTNGVPRPADDPTTPPELTITDVKLGLDPDRPEAPPGDQPPQIELSYPEWTKGTFAVLAPTSANLVTHAVVEGPLSLTGPNTAAIMMELTEAGATFMQKTLLEQTGEGASDLLPVGVRMSLSFLSRLPPVTLRVEADSRAVYKALESIDHDYDNYACRTDDIAHYETQLEMAVQAKLINVQLDTGMLELESDLVSELRSTAMEVVTGMMEKSFFEETEPPADETDLTTAETDYYILKQREEVHFESFFYKEQINSVVETEKHPQGTLQSFFAGVSAADMKKFVRVVDLTDTFFMTLNLEVNCFADFEKNPIAFVEVQLRYDGRDENGDQVQKQETFTFDKDNKKAVWDPSLIGAKREYFYRWRVGYTGREPGEFTDWERDRTPTLNLSIPDSGRVDLRILAGAIDFAQTVDHVQVTVTYEDRANDVEKQSQTFKLSDGQLEQRYTREIFADWDKPVTWQALFVLKDGQVIEGEEEKTVDRTLLINAPLFDKLDVGLVPVGTGWDQVTQTIINLVYHDDANDYHVDQAFQIKTLAEFKTWAVVLQNRDLRKFKYKVTTAFNDGDFHATDFIDADGDQSIMIKVDDEPRLDVSVMPTTVDFAATPVVTCTLRYDDDEADIHQRQTFAFDETKKNPESWRVAIADNERNKYSHEFVYHTFEGVVRREPVETDETVLVIPRVARAEVKCQFNARQLNFTDTPVVELHVDYEDPVNGRDHSNTFTLESPADKPLFQHPIGETSPTEFTVFVIYHKADGTMHEMDPVRLDRKQWVVPRYLEDRVRVEDPLPGPVG